MGESFKQETMHWTNDQSFLNVSVFMQLTEYTLKQKCISGRSSSSAELRNVKIKLYQVSYSIDTHLLITS